MYKNIILVAIGALVLGPVVSFAASRLTEQTKLMTLPNNDAKIYRIYDVSTNAVCYVSVTNSSFGQETFNSSSISCLPQQGWSN